MPCSLVRQAFFRRKKTNAVQGLPHSLAFIADKLNQAREQCEYKTLVCQQVLCSGLSTEAKNYIGVASRPIQTIFFCAIIISYKCITGVDTKMWALLRSQGANSVSCHMLDLILISHAMSRLQNKSWAL